MLSRVLSVFAIVNVVLEAGCGSVAVPVRGASTFRSLAGCRSPGAAQED